MRALVLLLACGVLAARVASAAEPVAVLELFTSEGCSSCPPAEKLLPQLAGAAGGRIIGMEWHVDYWDHLGWKDPFDSHAATLRQQAYATAMKSDQLYTPQLVIGGTRACVGSVRADAEAAVHDALARPAAVALTLHATAEGAAVRIDYALDAPRAGAQIGVALVSPAESVHVGAGENEGRTLAHTNVVLAWQETPLPGSGKGQVRITVPRGHEARALRAIALVEDRESHAILGAALTPVSSH
jgi:hypothetical protein